MKISLTLLIILTTLTVILPYLWFIRIASRNTQKQDRFFRDILKKENLNFNVKEQWNNNYLGIDKDNKILLFIKHLEIDSVVLKIDLNQIQSCQIKKIAKDIKKYNKTETELQTIDLELHHFTNGIPTNLNLFDTNELYAQDFEMKRAERWKALIDGIIPKPRTYRGAA